MVTTKEISAEFKLAATAIIDREGAGMLELYRSEGGAEQAVHHFDRNYRTLPLVDTPSADVCRTARELLGDTEFLRLLDECYYAAPLDVLYSEGVVSIVGGYFVISAEYRKVNYPVLR